MRRSAALVPVKPSLARPEPIRAKVLDVTPIRSEIVRHVPRKPVFRPHLRRSGIDWGIASLPPEERIKRETELCLAAQKREARDGGQTPGTTVSPVSAEGVMLAVRLPQASDSVILWSQYHALKALAVRFDAGIGSASERATLEAGLAEYNKNFERVRSERVSKGI